MKNKYIYLIVNIIIFGYLFYLLNPLFATSGHWLSWQGSVIAVLLLIISLSLDYFGLWQKFGHFMFQNKKTR